MFSLFDLQKNSAFVLLKFSASLSIFNNWIIIVQLHLTDNFLVFVFHFTNFKLIIVQKSNNHRFISYFCKIAFSADMHFCIWIIQLWCQIILAKTIAPQGEPNNNISHNQFCYYVFDANRSSRWFRAQLPVTYIIRFII